MEDINFSKVHWSSFLRSTTIWEEEGYRIINTDNRKEGSAQEVLELLKKTAHRLGSIPDPENNPLSVHPLEEEGFWLLSPKKKRMVFVESCAQFSVIKTLASAKKSLPIPGIAINLLHRNCSDDLKTARTGDLLLVRNPDGYEEDNRRHLKTSMDYFCIRVSDCELILLRIFYV